MIPPEQWQLVHQYFSTAVESIWWLPIAWLLRLPYLLLTRKHTTVRHELAFALFLCYLAVVNYLTMPTLGTLLRGQLHPNMNLVPFDGMDLSGFFSDLNSWGNVLMFLPMGFLLPMVWRIPGPLVVILGCFSSCLIEASQLFSFRATDVDDVILNTLGTLIGLLAFCATATLLPFLKHTFHIPHR